MAPKAKKGGGGGRTFRETPTEAHVAALELRAQVAEAAALELREAHLSAHNALVAEREALRGREGELEDVYSYVDTQMLHSARERHAYEKKIREAEEERAAAAETAEKEEEEARRVADATEAALREELAQKQAELDALVVFRELFFVLLIFDERLHLLILLTRCLFQEVDIIKQIIMGFY